MKETPFFIELRASLVYQHILFSLKALAHTPSEVGVC